MPEPFARWQDDTGKLKAAFFRLVIDPAREEGRPANLDTVHDGAPAGHAAVRELP